MIANNIIFDDLDLFIFFKIIIFFRKKKIYIFLDNNFFSKKIYLLIIKSIKINIILIENFYAGDIKKNNQAITLEVINHTNKNLTLILEKLSITLKREKFIDNSNYPHLKLHIAKLIQPELNMLYLKYFLIDHFVSSRKKIFLKQLNFICKDDLHDIKYLKDIDFYKKKIFFLTFFLNISKDFFEYFWAISINLINQKKIQDFKKKNKILTFHYNTISLNESYRSQSYWFDKNRAVKENLNLFVLKNSNLFKSKSIPRNLEKNKDLNSNNIFIIPSSFIFLYTSFFKILKNFFKYFLCFKKKKFSKKKFIFKNNNFFEL